MKPRKHQLCISDRIHHMLIMLFMARLNDSLGAFYRHFSPDNDDYFGEQQSEKIHTTTDQIQAAVNKIPPRSSFCVHVGRKIYDPNRTSDVHCYAYLFCFVKIPWKPARFEGEYSAEKHEKDVVSHINSHSDCANRAHKKGLGRKMDIALWPLGSLIGSIQW